MRRNTNTYIRGFLVTTLLVVTGLTAYHRYIEEKPLFRSLREATTEYVRAVRWVARQSIRVRRATRSG